MLVLRKEIKIGIGAGLVILGIAGVYGLMMSLSGGSAPKDQTAIANVDSGSDAHGAGVPGLPPKDDTVEPTPAPAPAPKPVEVKGGDPFAESNRNDGNAHNDVWASALTTGRMGGDVKPGGNTTAAPTIVKAPAQPKAESKLVRTDPAAANEGDITPIDTAKPAKTPAKSDDTASAAGSSKYVIQPGDTFSTISAKVYGSKKFYAALVKANPDVNPSKMRVGREIAVPPKESVASVGGAIDADRATLVAPIDASRQYRVAPGDTLSHIASKLYGKSTMWEAIYTANKTTIGPNEAKLKVGTLLDLPQKPVR